MPTLTNLTTGAVATVHEVIGYDATRPVEVVEHAVIGSPVPDFTLRAARTRRGRFELLCTTRAAGVELERFLTASGPYRLTADGGLPPTVFLVTGSVGVRFEATHTAIVSVDYTAVTP